MAIFPRILNTPTLTPDPNPFQKRLLTRAPAFLKTALLRDRHSNRLGCRGQSAEVILKNLLSTTRYKTFAIPLAAGALYARAYYSPLRWARC